MHISGSYTPFGRACSNTWNMAVDTNMKTLSCTAKITARFTREKVGIVRMKEKSRWSLEIAPGTRFTYWTMYESPPMRDLRSSTVTRRIRRKFSSRKYVSASSDGMLSSGTSPREMRCFDFAWSTLTAMRKTTARTAYTPTSV